MSKLTKPRWTLVQHSAWTGKQDPAFRNVVEPAGLTTHQQLGEVVDAGSPVFDSYNAADDAADDASRQALDQALFADQTDLANEPAELTFHPTIALGGRPLYVPAN